METRNGDLIPGKAQVGNYYYLPRGMVRVVGEPDSTKGYKITISRFNVPDHNSRYFLKQNSNGFFDDHAVLDVDDQGLLTTANVESEDKTAAVIDKVVETVVSVAKISANLGSNVAEIQSMEVESLKPFNCTFDPLDDNEVREARNRLNGAGFVLNVVRPRGSKNSEVVAQNASISKEGIYYRPPCPVKLSISPRSSNSLAMIENTVVSVPDGNEIAVFALSRPFLVKKTTNLTFVAGDLKKVDFQKPSEVLAAVSIPASIASKIGEAIPSIIQIQDSRANAALKEEKARLDAQKALLDAQLALRNSQTALDAAGGGGAGGSSSGAESAVPHAFLTGEEKKLRKEAAVLDAQAAKVRAQNAKERENMEKARIENEKAVPQVEEPGDDNQPPVPDAPKEAPSGQ